MSFRKLKEEYPDYKGGLLLIDEADAGLFPAAQTKLLDILDKECNDLHLQVVMTSHSPTLIERTYDLSQKYRRKYKTIYLSDTFGSVRSMHDYSWSDIYSDLLTTTVLATDEISLPKINVYFEDKEGFDFFNTVLFRYSGKKFINSLSNVSLGCSNYIQLVKRGVPEFFSKSIIVLDADVEGTKNLDSIILLPGTLPPDQLIFEFLYNLPPDDDIWMNSIRFTKPVFTQCASEIISALSVGICPIDLKSLIDIYMAGNEERKKKLREVFKKFYKTAVFQQFLALKDRQYNPWKKWVHVNQADCEKFRELFTKRLVKTMRDGYGVDASKLISL
jgi:hypothetical protein